MINKYMYTYLYFLTTNHRFFFYFMTTIPSFFYRYKNFKVCDLKESKYSVREQRLGLIIKIKIIKEYD